MNVHWLVRIQSQFGFSVLIDLVKTVPNLKLRAGGTRDLKLGPLNNLGRGGRAGGRWGVAATLSSEDKAQDQGEHTHRCGNENGVLLRRKPRRFSWMS